MHRLQQSLGPLIALATPFRPSTAKATAPEIDAALPRKPRRLTALVSSSTSLLNIVSSNFCRDRLYIYVPSLRAVENEHPSLCKLTQRGTLLFYWFLTPAVWSHHCQKIL